MEVSSEGESRTDEPTALVFQFAFECHHRHLSRVFTIKHRSYRVCFDCGREFDLPKARAARAV
jgi:hypothetical protein